MTVIYTIGHSSHTPDKFVGLLAKVEIQVLADVRSNPTSKWAPWANRDNLRKLTGAAAIPYIYLGDVLGGHPADPDIHNPQTGKVDYQRILKEEYFKRGITRLLEEARKARTCIMCAEEDPGSCHRNLLVGEALRQQDVTVLHLRGDGRIQTDEEVFKEKAGLPGDQFSLPL